MDIMRQEVSLIMGQLGWTDVGKAGPDSLLDLLDPEQDELAAGDLPADAVVGYDRRGTA